MFANLLDTSIQPKQIDVTNIPEISISASLRSALKNALLEEEGGYVEVFDKTSVVKTDRTYVFFSNQWLYLASACRKFAEALRVYADFFDNEVRGNQEVLDALFSRNSDADVLIKLLPDQADRENMIKYVTAETPFRQGKNYKNTNGSIRTTKDVFGSCVLKMLPVPDASSAYLGTLIFYLSKRKDLYNSIEEEVLKQSAANKTVHRLPDVVKDCAKVIVDTIYRLDRFDAIKERIEVIDKSIKFNTYNTNGLLPEGNFLRYMFALPSSDMYNPETSDGKTRVFEDEYKIMAGGVENTCRLTTEWVGSDIVEGMQGNNYLQALIALVNYYYKEELFIKKESDGYYIEPRAAEFIADNLPAVFRDDYSQRVIKSLLAKPFVILTGNSGTGKTRIAKQFAEYLEVEDNWLIVPVGADWTDNTKILGFHNPLGNEYIYTEIVRLIERANSNKDIPYFLILDEMNLSHVERYFSDFLSHMETPDNPFVLDGYKNGKLEYPDNMFVVGTVNIDETTYMFSPKVLDRANVVEFKPEKKSVIKLFDTPASMDKVVPAGVNTARGFLRLAKEIRSGKCNVKEEDMQKVMDVFGAVYDIVEKNGFEFAYRTVREIRQYISAAHELNGKDESFSVYAAIDEQLLQKILPKIHGNRKEIGDLLDELEEISKEEGKLLELSARKITQMKMRLANVQYASFI